MRESFGDDVVAVGDVARHVPAPFVGRLAGEARAGGREVFIDGPGERAVIDDHVVGIHRGDRVGLPAAALFGAGRAGTNAQVLDDHIVRRDVDARLDERDAGRGRSLSGDGEKRFGDPELALAEIDDATDFEYDDARAFRVECFDEGAGAVRRERRDLDDLPAAPALRVCGPAERTREGDFRCRRARRGSGQNGAGDDQCAERAPERAEARTGRAVTIDFHQYSPVVDVVRVAGRIVNDTGFLYTAPRD